MTHQLTTDEQTILIDIIKERIIFIISGIESYGYIICKTLQKLDILKTDNIYNLTNQFANQFINSFYCTLRDKKDEEINEKIKSFKDIIIMHNHCIIVLLIKIIKTFYEMVDRNNFITTDLKTYIESIQTDINIIFNNIEQNIIQDLIPCTDDCIQHDINEKNPFSFVLYQHN